MDNGWELVGIEAESFPPQSIRFRSRPAAEESAQPARTRAPSTAARARVSYRSAPALLGLLLLLTQAASPALADEEEKLDGYAEYRNGSVLIVEGQRVTVHDGTRFKGAGEARDFASIPLGYRVKMKGIRQPDGSVVAQKIEAKPNDEAFLEADLRSAFDETEKLFRSRGRVFELGSDGEVAEDVGRLLESGPKVKRARAITRRLVPPYMRAEDFRVYVIENEEWNAMAAPNNSIYVFSGLLDDMDDDEVAIVLGHELVHATHEHSRKQAKKGLFIELGTVAVAAVAEEIDNEELRTGVQVAAFVGAGAWINGYGRGYEDQADSVGLRYAYEGGYDVQKGPGLWQRFANKYGDPNKVVNFFFGEHSVAKDRARNLERELRRNYRR